MARDDMRDGATPDPRKGGQENYSWGKKLGKKGEGWRIAKEKI